MDVTLKRVGYRLLIFLSIVMFAALFAPRTPELLQNLTYSTRSGVLLELFTKLPFLLASICFILGFRYGNLGLALSGLSFFLIYYTLNFYALLDTFPEIAAIILPLHLILFSTLTNRLVLTPYGLTLISLIALEGLLLALIFNIRLWEFAASIFLFEGFNPHNLVRMYHSFFGSFHSVLPTWMPPERYPMFFSVVFSLAFFAYKFIKRNNILSAGFAGALVASSLGIYQARNTLLSSVYFSIAGLILIAAFIETAFFKAYLDELTGLPGRRGLNKTLTNLGKRYTIAMIDIDHFKKFNDKYGHKTGDQALRMVSSKLLTLGGAARVFRYGGEEFTVVFRGKSLKESIPYLERLRKNIETSRFIVRKPELRKAYHCKRNKGLYKNRSVKLTVSVGVAASDKVSVRPDQVLKQADKKLYSAKKRGRNRVTF